MKQASLNGVLQWPVHDRNARESLHIIQPRMSVAKAFNGWTGVRKWAKKFFFFMLQNIWNTLPKEGAFKVECRMVLVNVSLGAKIHALLCTLASLLKYWGFRNSNPLQKWRIFFSFCGSYERGRNSWKFQKTKFVEWRLKFDRSFIFCSHFSLV